ncbi:hypothetical protein P9112_011505 [Eukaryota sp. TZLM1-RC]
MPRRSIESTIGTFAGYLVILFCLIIHIVGLYVWINTISSLSVFSPRLAFLMYIPFLLFYSLAVISYLRTCFTSPGTPSPVSNIDPSHYCSKCNVPKEHRTHHCSVCNKCILEMDHHCIWLANCVGRNNRKYFLLFLTYECFLNLTVAACFLYIFIFRDEVGFLFGGYLSGGLFLVLSSVLSLCVVPFAGYHYWLVCNGMTTLEHISVGFKHKSWDRPWHLGPRKNLKIMFGPFPRCFLPVPSTFRSSSYEVVCNDVV